MSANESNSRGGSGADELAGRADTADAAVAGRVVGSQATADRGAGVPDAGMQQAMLDDVAAAESVSTAGRSAPADTATDADAGAASADPAADTGSPTQTGPATAAQPMAAAACGDDLDARNGSITLSLGELPPSAAFSGDPAANGSFTFTTQAISVELSEETFAGAGMQIAISAGRISGSAWLPDDEAVHELVLLLPGFGTSYTAYTAYAEHLASHGFVVVGMDTRSNLLMSSHDTEAVEVVRTIDWLLEGSPFKGRIDPTKIAVAGHSKGGKLAFFSAALDARIDLVIGWDPVNGGGGPCAFDPNCNAMPVAPNCAVMSQGIQQYMRAETLVIGAPPDPDLNPEAGQNCVQFYRGAPSPAALILLETGHAAWTSGASEPEVFRITKAAHLARLLQRFRGATGLDDYLPGSPKLAADMLVKQQASK